jgi:hypothetical protein
MDRRAGEFLAGGIMQGFTFIPDESSEIDVPYLEDARADFAPYWTEVTHKPTLQKIKEAQVEVAQELGKLGAIPVKFVEGIFGRDTATPRYGVEVCFVYAGAQGVLRVAGLPIRSETEQRKLAVKIQALKIVRDWLKAAVTARVFSPGNEPLLGYLLVPGDLQRRTLAEFIKQEHDVPLLVAPSQVIEVE